MVPPSETRVSRFSGKVFGIGLPETATTSLEDAFEHFGYSKLGFSRKGLEAYLEAGFGDEVRQLVDRHDAFADWPWCLCYKELFLEYGENAKFVLTRRSSSEIWLRSVLASSLHANAVPLRQKVYGFAMPHGHEGFLVDHYNRHTERVREFFAAHNAMDQLLELDIGAENSWAKLCDFLEVGADERGFAKKNATGERELNKRTLFSNLGVLNRAQRGLDRSMLTFPEASQAVAAPEWRDPRTYAALQRYSRVGLELADLKDALKNATPPEPQRQKSKLLGVLWIGAKSGGTISGNELSPKDEIAALVSTYVDMCFAEIEAKKLFGCAERSEVPGKTGYEELGRPVAANLSLAVNRFVAQNGVLPNLLFPQTFSEFNILAKAFTRFPTGPLEDKIEAETLVPASVRHLLEDHKRPYVSETPDLPDNDQVPPGHYLWKANFGYALYDMVEFPIGEEVRTTLEENAAGWLQSPSNLATGQWWTAHVKRKVFLEERISSPGEDPKDWKFFVFGGRVGMLQVDFGRHSDHHQSAYDRDFTRLDIDIFAKRGDDVEKPERYENMVAIAEAIGKAFDFIRVDLYCEDGKIYLGELSPVPNAGFKPFRSQALDFKLGALWPKDSVLRQDLDWYYNNCNTGSQHGLPD